MVGLQDLILYMSGVARPSAQPQLVAHNVHGLTNATAAAIESASTEPFGSGLDPLGIDWMPLVSLNHNQQH